MRAIACYLFTYLLANITERKKTAMRGKPTIARGVQQMSRMKPIANGMGKSMQLMIFIAKPPFSNPAIIQRVVRKRGGPRTTRIG